MGALQVLETACTLDVLKPPVADDSSELKREGASQRLLTQRAISNSVCIVGRLPSMSYTGD